MDTVGLALNLAHRIATQRDHIKTEEATKTALILPFIKLLGYDLFNPEEVIPEFTADVGIKKGEKVDYAIKKDGVIVMLIECKCLGSDLSKEHASQLFRYFTVTDSRLGVLTDGAIYRFYSDLEQSNKMDSRPFFEFDLRNFRETEVEELKKFSKESFSLSNILATASSLKYLRAAKRIITDEIADPSIDFIKFVASKVHDGRMTAPALEMFKPIIHAACQQFLDEKMDECRKDTLTTPDKTEPLLGVDTLQTEHQPSTKGWIVTTAEEIEGHQIVKAIVRQAVDASRVTMRDTQSYCGVLLDDNNRKPICRLYFNNSQKYLAVFDKKQEQRIPIKNLDEIYQHADRMLTTVKGYEA
ncbi:type I restriction enzyme HsdR N-terminal domain-containing protein [Thiothrix litoralis]|jgi:hypothetical protein|uniref:Type I restriction enzyme HsdR N-terminal domain-containing protein n=1 Tax=Thiothrix litoralis TaxID=2891210 RepID=A0ABX7WP66_9GAMM|nr:type I restriction endonuclease [Thiothrix litoralis]QTR45295.1 type I restriction enzyme HsdR N-terminal domain-containing protein [Thiothrix litoralis]